MTQIQLNSSKRLTSFSGKSLAFGLAFFALLHTPQQTVALAPIAPDPQTITQPDGSTFTAYPKGNMLANWLETEAGYTVVKSANGGWFYAELNAEGELVPTEIEVGEPLEAAKTARLTPGVRPAPRQDYQLPKPENPVVLSANAEKGTQVQVPLLVVLVNFSDISFAYPDSAFQSLAFGATGSIKQFYEYNTYNQFTFVPAQETYGVANDGVIHVTLDLAHPNFRKNYSDSGRVTTLTNATLAANPFINFSSFDRNANGSLDSSELSIMFITAGYETAFGGENAKSPSVWGHVAGFSSPTVDGVTFNSYTMFGERHASGTTADRIATQGIMCHEIGHLTFGLPDLYDTDSSSFGMGKWCLMSHGTWERKILSGDSPIGLSSWCKLTAGILTPQELIAPQSNVQLSALNTSAQAIRLWIDPYKINEYFLLENRQLGSVEQVLPGTGLLITHVDQTISSNANEARRLVDVEEADGLNELDTNISIGDQGDLFPGSSLNRSFSQTTTPSSRSNDGLPSNIALSGITESNKTITLNVDSVPPLKGNITYLDNRAGFGSYGYNGSTTAWSAVVFTNPADSPLNLIEGVQVYIGDSTGAQINAFLYERFSGNKLTNLIQPLGQYNKTQSGWHRLFFDNPQFIAPGQTRVLALQFTLQFNNYPIAIDFFGQNSGNCFIGFSQNSTFTPIPYDVAQYILMGSQEPVYDAWNFY